MNTRSRITMATVALANGLAGASSLGQPQDTGMQGFQWQNRPLLVFGQERDDPRLVHQCAVVAAHADGFAERDMVVVAVVGDRPVTVDGTPAKNLADVALRRRYRALADAFAATLVGKDGTNKLRVNHAIGVDTLFQTIDAMPMRWREMRQNGAADRGSSLTARPAANVALVHH